MLTDEPEKIGGENAGPNPMELLLCSLVGCNQATANIVNERKFKLPIESINYKAEGIYDARGFFGVDGVSPAYQSIEVMANVTPKAGETITQAELDALGRVVGSRCPVEALFTAANIPVVAACGVWKVRLDRPLSRNDACAGGGSCRRAGCAGCRICPLPGTARA